MYNTILFGVGAPNYIEFNGYDVESLSSEFMLEELKGDKEIHQRFCDAGQNWIIWDHQRKNTLREPVIVIADHGLTVEDIDDFPGQDKIAFGIGGLFLRLMSQFILNDTDYEWDIINLKSPMNEASFLTNLTHLIEIKQHFNR